ncbi:unnamed protein product [Prunus armeniaca]
MFSPKIRAQGSSSSVPPAYITRAGVDKHAIEVRSKLHPFAQNNLDENVLHLFENTLVLGPHWFGHVPAEMASLFKDDVEALLCFESTSALASQSWVSKNLSHSFPSNESAGIYDAILLSKQSINRDENLLATSFCFWNSPSNTFDFRVGLMARTLLDMAQIFRFRPYGRPIDAVGDYHRRKNQEKLAKPFTISPASINQKFVFPNRSSVVLLKYRHLVEALHIHTDVGLGPTVYFLELRFPDIIMLENQVLALPLMLAEVPKRLIEYLMFFRHYTKRSAAQWQVVIRRTYPWFQLEYWLFVKEPEKEAARIDFMKKFLNNLDARYAVKKINHSANALYLAWEPNSCSFAEFDAWWKAIFQGLPASSTALQVLFDGWDSWVVHVGEETHRFMVQTIKDINTQIIKDPSFTRNIGAQSVQAGEMIVTSVIAAGDLELSFGDEEGETQVEQPVIEVTPSGRRNKRKETAPVHESTVQPETLAESPPPPPTKSKRLRKRTVVQYVATEGPTTALAASSGTDEELREAFEAAEQEKEQDEGDVPLKEKSKDFEEKEEIPAEAEPFASELVEQEELLIVVEVPRTAGTLAVVTSPLKPPIVAMPIHSLLGSSTTASFVDPELAEFEAMDLDAQLDKLEKLSSTPGKAKSKAVNEAMDRVKIWQSIELDLDENQKAIDQLMKDLDLLHRENMAPRPTLEMSLSLARDVLNLHDRYEDLKPTFKTSDFCKATHKANLADYVKQKAELDQMVAGYKEAKATADKLEKQIEELQK